MILTPHRARHGYARHQTEGGRRMAAMAVVGWAAACGASSAWAQSHPTGVPALNSRPGAAYTIYLDFAGFSFTGGWGGSGNGQPGTIPAYFGAVNGFSTSAQGYIDQVWSGIAEKYSAFNVNVTTVDPAVTAGQASTDAARQAYYDTQPRMMHTIIGDTSFTAAGVSYVGVTPYTYGTSDNNGAGDGFHTNFVTPTGTGGESGVGGIVGAAAHENGHGLGLSHQSDYNASGGLVNDYSSNNGAGGNGSVSPVMGVTYYSQRGVWRKGTSDQNAAIQDDVAVIANDPDMGGLRGDGVGHTLSTAVAIPTTVTSAGTIVNFAYAKGVIVPASSSSPNPLGVSNYTTDYMAFNSAGGAVSLTLHNGGSRVLPGMADAAVMLASTLSILDASGNVLYTAADNFATQTETITQTLPAGKYYAMVTSAGGQVGQADSTAGYYDMGSYFLTGTGVTGGRSVGAFYWSGGASASAWSTLDGGTATNWRTERTGGVDTGAIPANTGNVFLSVDSGATGLQSMTLGGNRTINSLTFTGTGTTAATTGVTVAADGSTLTLSPVAGHIDGSGSGVAAGVALAVQAGAAANTFAANLNLASGQTWQLGNSATSPLTVSGTVGGAVGAGLNVTGGGKLVLTAANTYSGGTTVSGTTVTFGAGSLGTGPVVLNNGGLIQFGAGNTADLTAGGRLVAVVSGGGQVDTNGNNVTLANGVADAFAGYLTKVGAGTLTVGGTSNPTNLFVRAGAMTLASGAAYSTANGGTGNQYVSIGQVAGDVGTLTVSGGATLTTGGDLNAGDVSSTGTINVLPSATVNARNLFLGKYGSSTGTVVQTGGVVQEADNGAGATDWRIGGGGSTSDKASVGVYNLSGGSLNDGGQNLQVGAYGTGTVIQTGGSFTVGAYLAIGRFPGSVGTFDMSAGNGTLTANSVPSLIVGEQGTGTLKVGGSSTVNANTLAVALSDGTTATGTVFQTGGTVNAPAGVAFGGAASGSPVVSATYNLSGGRLVTSAVTQGTAAGVTGTFHFAGGTLAPTASTTTFMQGLTRADIAAGPAVVDTAAFNVTVAQPLLHNTTITGADGGLTKLGTGTLTLSGLEAYTGPTNVSAGVLTFAAGPVGGGYRRQLLPGGLTVAAGASTTLAPTAARTDRTLLIPTGLSVAGKFDLNNNDLDVVLGSLPAITALAASGFAGGAWNGVGLDSSTAAADGAHLTAVGVIANTVNGTTPLYATFDGRTGLSATDVLARYTFYGDTNLDGVVNAADYTRLDAGFITAATGWAHGDFNYDGVVDGSDYTLADNAFNRQTGGIAAPAIEAFAAPLATAAAQVAAVPEPTAVALAAVGLVGVLGRRRRSPVG